ncbi:hypothetical protein pdam_00014345 [Pocillopora damicornis]|uniref:Uncharacterized protein n=2 Tax=Pocillopora damicornis TaxID=46731 RepID=A0A3M6TFN5_POCDA|nr:uncharacterized protein LOC113678184 isoform X2 [Pocillopora damicornis]RMX40226.1 hypothetical protein pdam_00014345 [Pocillopora damicornis]
MSDNVFLRDQESCVKDDYYMIDVFTYARPATNGETGSLHQLVMYVTRALEDSGRLDILREKQRDQNIMKIYSNSFRWKKTQGENIIAQLLLGGFHADKKIERKKVDHMKLAENVVFTLPVSDASKMTVEGNLLNEDGEMILKIGAMNVNLIKFQDGETRAGIEHEYSGNEAVEQDVAT